MDQVLNFIFNKGHTNTYELTTLWLEKFLSENLWLHMIFINLSTLWFCVKYDLLWVLPVYWWWILIAWGWMKQWCVVFILLWIGCCFHQQIFHQAKNMPSSDKKYNCFICLKLEPHLWYHHLIVNHFLFSGWKYHWWVCELPLFPEQSIPCL